MAPNEYTGLLVMRQLHRPLFRAHKSGVVPDLLAAPERLGENQWRFRVVDDAAWGDGVKIQAIDVARSIHEAISQPRLGWARGLLKRVEVDGRSDLIVTTRRRVAVLERLLAMPIFAPHDHARPSGKFRAERIGSRTVRLRAMQPRTTYDVDLVTTRSRETGRRLYEAGALDLGWGVGVPSRFWEPTDQGPFHAPVELDMHFVVTAGREIDASEANDLLDSCFLAKGVLRGVSSTDTRFATRGSVPRHFDVISRIGRKWPLYYSSFPPNREIAAEISISARGRLVPTKVSYEKIFGASRMQDGFMLSIHASAFPGVLGNLVETAAMFSPSALVDDDLAQSARLIWSRDASGNCGDALQKFEKCVDRALRRRVVGKLQSRFRGNQMFDLPVTGIFDFAELARRVER